MKYYFDKILNGVDFEHAIASVMASLKKEGFGVLTTIDMKKTMLEKLGVDLKNYTILGTCNPAFAYKALQHEANIGLLLPCNIVVRELEDQQIAVSAIDPISSMSMVENDALAVMAQEVQQKMKQVIAQL